ncbi:MAG: hypothetical protein EOP04_13015 [Proteobacteria bacterium]|nr:MAG: hypothetical protein EOP04_13015 [Pseudomonadota bacterium]
MALSDTRQLDQGSLAFRAEARLLQELGERLVAQPEVALVELIKNSYDADSTICKIAFTDNGKTLIVADNGHGMTKEEFESRWMTIATSKKAEERVSRKYIRDLTGQKGIGRFAVRFLGTMLQVVTVAHDKQRGCKTRLVADFDWYKIDENPSLVSTSIPYKLYRADDTEKEGTTLHISGLRRGGDFAHNPSFRSSVLNIVSPLAGLDRGRFKERKRSGSQDPGFNAYLPGYDDNDALDVAKFVLDNAWATLSIDLFEGNLKYEVKFYNDAHPHSLILDYPSNISAGIHADIRFFPRRQGLFTGKGVDGRTAYTWVRNNSGVVVVDRGFRVKPYGDPDDDWLSLDRDSAANAREWRSLIAREFFPIVAREKNDPALSPALNLPANHQLVGAVFVQSSNRKNPDNEEDLIPSTDREGFLRTEGFSQLNDLVRAGIEFLARVDKTRTLSVQEEQARAAARQVKEEYKAAIEFVQSVPTLSTSQKTRLVKDYSNLSKKIDEVEEYDREARRKLEVMGSLGVVAGFLTHEASRIVSTIQDAAEVIKKLSSQHPELRSSLSTLTESYEALKSHLEYTKLFVDATHNFKAVQFKSAPQVRRVVEKFGRFAEDRGVTVSVDIPSEVMVPAMPVTVYSGILLNLYTNALKAVLAIDGSAGHMQICFKNSYHSI